MSLMEEFDDVAPESPLVKRLTMWGSCLVIGAIGFGLAWVAWHLWADHVLLHNVVQFLSKPPGKP